MLHVRHNVDSLLEKSLTVFRHNLLFLFPSPFLTKLDSWYASLNGASENIVPELGYF